LNLVATARCFAGTATRLAKAVAVVAAAVRAAAAVTKFFESEALIEPKVRALQGKLRQSSRESDRVLRAAGFSGAWLSFNLSHVKIAL